jgi:hypothetical protein
MNAVAALMKQDRDQCFADWGVEIALREVLQSYEPEAGEIAESYIDHALNSLVQTVEMAAAQGTGGQHAAAECVFLVRREDIAEQIPLRTARVVHAEVEYRVEAVDQSADGGLLALRCRRV